MADNPFKGIVISLSGTFKPHTHARLIKLIKGMGAQYSKEVTHECTHLVTTYTEVRKPSHRVKTAYNVYTVEIVSEFWLHACVAAKRPVPESGYKAILNNPNNWQKRLLPGQVTGMKRLLDAEMDYLGDRPEKRIRIDSGEGASGQSGIANTTAPGHEPKYSVYIDEKGVEWSAIHVRCTAGGRSNRYYCHRILSDEAGSQFISEHCSGRVGQTRKAKKSSRCTLADAKFEFMTIFRAKTGIHWSLRHWATPRPKKYRYIGPMNIDATMLLLPECSLPQSVQLVLGLIFYNILRVPEITASEDTMRKMPLGPLTGETLIEGYHVLQNLAELISNPDLANTRHDMDPLDARIMLSSEYFSLVPHSFGPLRAPILSTQNHITKELALLDELADFSIYMETENSTKGYIDHPLDLQFSALGLQEMTPVEHACPEFSMLKQYFDFGVVENYQIRDIFRTQVGGEAERFRSSRYSKMQNSNRRLLWHGSATTNFAGILSQGLLVSPKGVHRHGASYGKGIYFSDLATISIMFTSISGIHRCGMLLLCDVELGTSYKPLYPVYGGNTARQHGAISTQVMGFSNIERWIDAQVVDPSLAGTQFPLLHPGYMYDSQYVAHDPAQVQIKYLVFFSKA